MGFSTALQGRAAHEAIILRQDAELRLMETMKRCFQMKAKCDREYAASLATVAQQGLKIDRADDMQGSLITKSWRSYMDELDQQAKQFRVNAELLEVICEKLAHLSQDKRKARKSYQEEHAKIAVRLNHKQESANQQQQQNQQQYQQQHWQQPATTPKNPQMKQQQQATAATTSQNIPQQLFSSEELTDEVLRKKSEYQKHLEGYKALRTRFEEHYIKCGRGGRKLDDVRDKYQKACRKLHLTHNEYVLSITEAVEVEKDFRTVLLPGLLEHQQSVQESFILLWKNILQEASQHGDLTSEKFTEIQKRIDNVINKINPNEEYREFTEKHKTSPTSPIVFQFDETLIEDIPGKLQSNTLTVDNLTVDWLRSRLNDLEGSVKECQEKQIKLIGDLNGGSPITNGVNGNSNKDSQNRNSKDLNSLRCQEKQKQKLLDMIKSALSEVGCEELPSGCDDHLNVDQTFIENSFNNDNQTRPASNVSIMNDFIRRGGVLTLLRGPFKRKAATPQPTTPISTSRNRHRKHMQPRSHSLGSLTVITAIDECKTNLRLSASMEANNNYDSDDIVVFDPFPKSPKKPVSAARHSSMLCVIEEPPTNIYPELEVNDNQFVPVVASHITNNPSNANQQNIQIEINHVGTEGDRSSLKVVAAPEPIPSQTPHDEEPQPSKDIEDNNSEPMVKSSIDAHLDKIDEINRSLDDKLKRSLPRFLQPTGPADLNAIESVEHRTSASEIQECSSKRTSSSSSDTRPSITRKQSSNTAVGKKRSISFSHKSINSILCNIKDFKFPRSPLTRGLRGSQPSTEDREINEILEGVTVLSKKPSPNEEVTLPNNMETSTDCSENEASTKPKIKTPKMKKSKAIRNTFRTKLISFQMRRGKTCKSCAKKRRIHPSKSVFDFAKEFNLTSWNEDDFCACPDDENQLNNVSRANNTTNDLIEASGEETNDEDDFLSIKDHKYCEPSIAGMSLSSNRPLYEEEWFHGVLPREEVVRLLNNDGDFLVRETIRNEESQIVLSVCWNGHKHFIVQTTVDGHFRFEGPPFPSIQELIMHQYQSELPVTVKSGAILRRPICRERWELSNDDVMLLEKIGRGNFGDVYKAKLKSTKLDVAVKTCRMTLPDEQKRKFLQEGRILKQYDHPNIVKLIGICVQKQPIMIVMELVPGGSLLNFLRKNSNSLTARQLMGMCRDAAAGMRYLESKNCIHRDLAARNCLIDLENSVKISDFGMSREEEEYIVSDGMKQIPVKWTAPEALNFGKYTCLCDVWSYGILMWEIFSKGDTPYSGMSNSKARERIDTGYRMPAPENTPPEMYRLMLKCWAAEADSRPHFDEIFNVVDALIIRYDNTHN